MPFEQASFWIRFHQSVAIGTTNLDYNVPLGRNIELQGIGVAREDTLELFRFHLIFEDGRVKRIIPRENAAVPNEDYVTAPTVSQYREHWAEIPFSPYRSCDIATLRCEVLNSGAGSKTVEGHFRGIYIG